MIINGTINATRKGKKTKLFFQKGDIMGDQSLYYKSLLRTTLIVESENFSCLAIGISILERIFGKKIMV